VDGAGEVLRLATEIRLHCTEYGVLRKVGTR
jgi:hypothetical protein